MSIYLFYATEDRGIPYGKLDAHDYRIYARLESVRSILG